MERGVGVHVLHLRIVVEGGGWRLSAGDGAGRPAEARLERGELAGCLARLARPAAAPPRVLVPGRDGATTRAEEALGEALGDLLRLAPPVHGRLMALAGRAAGAGALAALAIDAEDAQVRALPWELLALDGAIASEAAGQVVIARLAGSGPAPDRRPPDRQPGRGLWLRPWCETPGDPACAALLARLSGLGLPADGADGAGVMHVVAHGRAGLEAVALALSENLGAGAAGARLAGSLDGAGLVVMAVCGAGATVERELDDLAGRLLACGARSVIAPLRELSAEALGGFADGLYAALSRGAPPAAAVAEGRRRLRAWGHPHRSNRWFGLGWFVRDLRALSAPPLASTAWSPARWPPPDPQAGALLARARELSRARGDGYLGAEHLLAALRDCESQDPAVIGARRWLGAALAGHDAATRALVPQAGGRALALTPRLEGWPLSKGFGLSALCALLTGAPWPGPAAGPLSPARSAPPGDETWATADAGAVPPGAPARTLEVIGGPEDGRVLSPSPGDTLGRYADAGGPDLALYTDTPLTDRKLSRRHLTWIGPGQLTLARGATRVRGGAAEPVAAGPQSLLEGDRLLLTESTCLLAGARP